MEPAHPEVVSAGERRRRSTSAPLLLGAAMAAAVLCIGGLVGCGGDDDKASPQSLKDQLLPASEIPGFKSEREFDFDNPIDFAHEALPLSEATPLSQAVDAFENAGFEAGVGERFVKGKPFEGPGSGANQDIAELGSDNDAREALDYVRKEALKQPCFAVCSVEGKEFAVAGIPGAKGVQQTPLSDPPPNAPPPFASYGVGFTIGPRLYIVGVGGAPGQVKKDQVVEAAEALYKRNAEPDAGS
jgi:hypothetical protein